MILPEAAHLSWIDCLIVVVYFAFVLGVGVTLRRYMRTSNEFFLPGRSIPAWVCALAFLAANLGAQEVIGMGAAGAKYGIATSHFYWIGAVPAMIFLALFMMPFFYGSRARSMPDYLRLRFDEKTRALNAVAFAAMHVLSTGISLYAMALVIELLGLVPGFVPAAYRFDAAVGASAAVVLAYILLGGLSSAMYNDVLQFFLLVAAFAPMVWVGLRTVGGWGGIRHALPGAMTHAWQGMGSGGVTGTLGVGWVGLAMGLGFVLSFGYWCTDFLVIQRALAADSEVNARRVPLLAAVPKMLFPFLVILPGLIAVSATGSLTPARPHLEQTLTRTRAGVEGQAPVLRESPAGSGLIPAKLDPRTGAPRHNVDGTVELNYDLAIPVLLLHVFPNGMLGLGLTALLASFMSGMAGNMAAFNTLWTYDLYQAYVHRRGSDAHYASMGRLATVGGMLLAVGAAFMAAHFNNIMDALQLVFSLVNAPLFATFLLGMFVRRVTGHAAFAGLLAGVGAALVHHGLTLSGNAPTGLHGGWLRVVHTYPTEMAQNFRTATLAFAVNLAVALPVSLFTRPRPDSELVGLVYALTPRPAEEHLSWYQRPVTLAGGVLLLLVILNLVFA